MGEDLKSTKKIVRGKFLRLQEEIIISH